MPTETFNGRGTNFISKAGKTNFSYTMRTESGAGGDKDVSDPENIVFGGGGQGAHYTAGTILDSDFTDVGCDRLRLYVDSGGAGIELAMSKTGNSDDTFGDVTTANGQGASGSTGGFNDTPITEDFFNWTTATHIGGAGADGDGTHGGHGGGTATAIADGTTGAGAAEDTAGTNGKGGGGEHSVAAGAYSPSIVTISYDLLPTTAHPCNSTGIGIGIGL